MKTFHKAPLAMAITALMVAPYALAQGYSGYHNKFDTDSTIDSEANNKIDVEVTHDTDTYKNFYTNIWTDSHPDHYAGATVDSKQFIKKNDVENVASENNATVGGSSLRGATGNIGANVAAGDNNAQANDAALAVSDAEDVFGQAAAFSFQSTFKNDVSNYGSPNTASLGGDALRGASGNMQVNVAAGVYNTQQNSLAAAVNDSSGDADATTGGVQQAYYNDTTNTLQTEQEVVTLRTRVRVDASDLVLDQYGNSYPDTWGGETNDGNHESAPRIGHIDLDDEVQTTNKAGEPIDTPDFNDDGGALAFKATDDSILRTTVTEERLVNVVDANIYHRNNATLDGNALRGATGNIGVNVAAGSNNLQRNSLSLAAARGGMPGGGVDDDLPGGG